MAILDVIKFDGLANRDWLVYRFPGDSFTTASRVIVGEGQIAVFVKGGRALDFFSAGTHVLSTGNIPLLARFVNMPFGGKTPFTAEVYFINRTTKLDINWGTSDPIQIIDPKYNIKLRVRAFGQMGLKVSDYRVFITELIGSLSDREVVQFSKVLDFYKGVIITRIKSTISKVLIQDKISALEISAHLDDLSSRCRAEVENDFTTYGLRVINLFIKSINFPDEDFDAINKVLADKAAFDIIGDNRYVSKRSFDVLETAASNENGLAGTGMGLGIGMGAGVVAGGAMTQSMPGVLNTQANLSGVVNCHSCNHTNPADSLFCVNCGVKMLQENSACISCGSQLISGSRFCPKCGIPQTKIKCSSCGVDLTDDARFCPNCGTDVKASSEKEES